MQEEYLELNVRGGMGTCTFAVTGMIFISPTFSYQLSAAAQVVTLQRPIISQIYLFPPVPSLLASGN